MGRRNGAERIGEKVSFIDPHTRTKSTGTIVDYRKSSKHPWKVYVISTGLFGSVEVHPDRVTKLRNNSAEASAEAYESFHGREPQTDTLIAQELHEHRNLAGIGELIWMDVRCEADGEEYDVHLKGFKGALLSMGEDMEDCPQLFIEGGDQSVDLSEFGISEPYHELETLGRLVCVAYFTEKDHLGAEGGEADYVHAIEEPLDEDTYEAWGGDDVFGSMDDLQDETEDNTGPDVIFDTVNNRILLSGGSYELRPEGIDG